MGDTTQIRITKALNERLRVLGTESGMSLVQIAETLLNENIDAVTAEEFTAWPVPLVVYLRLRLKKHVPAAGVISRGDPLPDADYAVVTSKVPRGTRRELLTVASEAGPGVTIEDVVRIAVDRLLAQKPGYKAAGDGDVALVAEEPPKKKR